MKMSNLSKEDFDIAFYPEKAADEDKMGATVKGTSTEYKESQEKIADMFTKKGAEYTINKRKVKVLDTPKEKGCIRAEVAVTTLKGERGIVGLKFWPPNKKGATIQITRTKDTKILFCKTMTNKVITNLLETSNTKDKQDFKKTLLDTTVTGKTSEKLYRSKEKKDKIKEKFLNKTELKCNKCDFKTKIQASLVKHTLKEHGNKETTLEDEFKYIGQMGKEDATSCIDEESQANCNLCSFVPSNDMSIRTHTKQHHEKAEVIEQMITCENCDYQSKTNNEMTKHMDAKHIQDIWLVGTKRESEMVKTTSIEEPVKKKRHGEIKESDALLEERANKLDDKVSEKAKREEESEKKAKHLAMMKATEQKESHEREQTLRKKEKKALKKKKKKDFEGDEMEKAFDKAKETEDWLDKNFIEVCIPGNGACLMGCLGKHLFNDEKLGPKLGEELNKFIADNWFLFKDKIEYPFKRHVGGSESVEYTREEENRILDFLRNHPQNGFVWREISDIIAIVNKYNMDVKVVKIDSEGKAEITEIKPDGDFEITSKKKKKMVVVNRDNNHFNLLVPKEKKNETSEDKQKVDEVGEVEEVEEVEEMEEVEEAGEVEEVEEEVEEVREVEEVEEGEEVEKVEKVEEADQEKKDSTKEKAVLNMCCGKKIKELEAKVEYLIREFSNLKKTKCMEKKGKTNEVAETKTVENKTSHEREKPTTKSKKIKSKQDKAKKCDVCENEFDQDEELQKHLEKDHKPKGQFNCDNCDMQATSFPHLKKHMRLKGHYPSPSTKFDCRNCSETFTTYNDLMNHRRDKHEVKKICRYFLTGKCNYTEETCWFSHEAAQSRNQNTEKCKHCGNTFNNKKNLMMHNKTEHKEKVQICKNKDNCGFSDDQCWFRHERLDFHEAPNNHIKK